MVGTACRSGRRLLQRPVASCLKLNAGAARLRAKTPLQMMAEDLYEGANPSQTGGLDRGVAALQELCATERIAEQRIKEALSRGSFDNLKGAGQPLPEDRADLTDADALGAKILKDAGALPAWLEEQKALRADIQRLHAQAASGADVSREADVVNEKIRAYNRRCPPQFQQSLCQPMR
eukprot:TRINITY_DN31166_c0_g1_i1.p1 TRINITY_DN31166_c0_g1~~TRINITY_DN31166_c0_g1_i1.p1  ORF type:complete len:205 (-),score=47.92 TRINITY_DN31166_c0_g1_i1:317-850(-)